MQNDLNLQNLLSSSAPIEIFQNWWRKAQNKAQNIETEADAATVSTVADCGQPSSRVVLLRQVTDGKLIFFTNYSSRKGQDIAENPKVCFHFYWHHMGLQVEILGRAEKTSREVSSQYWSQRARNSQVSQAISKQSKPLTPDQSLESLVEEFENSHPESIDCPENWGGYQVTPHQWEFWIAQPNRLHHRVQFQKDRLGEWKPQQLYP